MTNNIIFTGYSQIRYHMDAAKEKNKKLEYSNPYNQLYQNQIENHLKIAQTWANIIEQIEDYDTQ